MKRVLTCAGMMVLAGAMIACDKRQTPEKPSAFDPSIDTKVVEFNDIEALEAALAEGDVACVLAEPALTNIGIVLPEPGFHAALRGHLARAARHVRAG